MTENPLSSVPLADRHHGLAEGVRGLIQTTSATVVMVADHGASLQAAVDRRTRVAAVDLRVARSCVSTRAIVTDPLPAVQRVRGDHGRGAAVGAPEPTRWRHVSPDMTGDLG